MLWIHLMARRHLGRALALNPAFDLRQADVARTMNATVGFLAAAAAGLRQPGSA